MWKSIYKLSESKQHKEVCTTSSVDLGTSALFQATFKQLAHDTFLLGSFSMSPPLSPVVFHSMTFENNL